MFSPGLNQPRYILNKVRCSALFITIICWGKLYFSARICSLHFKATDFEVPLKQKLLNYCPRNSRHLKADAIPTVNLPFHPVAERNEKRFGENQARLQRLQMRRRREIIDEILTSELTGQSESDRHHLEESCTNTNSSSNAYSASQVDKNT